MRVAFSEFVFDSERRSLERKGRPLTLTPKAFRLLEVLIERRPRAVSRAELCELVWPDVVVVAGNLANLAVELRRCLGDGSDRIRTVRKFGYRFEGEVESLDVPAGTAGTGFQLILGERHIALRPGSNPLGRGPDSVVSIGSPGVSRNHARILVSGTKAVIEDLASRNGTFVSGRRVRSPVELHDGDSIVLGSQLIGVVESLPDPGPTESLCTSGKHLTHLH